MKRAKRGIAKATTIANTIATTMNIHGMNAWNTTRIAGSAPAESRKGLGGELAGLDPEAKTFARSTLPTLQTHLNKIQSIAQSAGLIADAD
jgi:hypothetical protein